MKRFLLIFFFCCLIVVSVLGLRGSKSKKTPLYIFPDMDWQAKYLTQEESPFFADGRTDRPVVAGTILRGYKWNEKEVFSSDFEYEPAKNPTLFSGKSSDGDWATEFPLEVNHELLSLGQQKYQMTCYVCHGDSGDGNGITKKYGMVATPTYHDDRLRDMPIGEIYNTIKNGKNTMLGYGSKLTARERWAVAAYVRALQKTQNATLAEVPQEFLNELNN